MSTTTTSPRPSKATRHVPLWRRALPWVGGALLFAGAIVALVVFVGNTASDPKETFSNEPAVDVTKPQKNIKVPAEVRSVAAAVHQDGSRAQEPRERLRPRRPVDQAGHDACKEWKTGNIAVIPFPVDKLDYAPFKVDYSHSNDVLMEVALLPKQGSGVKGQTFFIGIKKFGKGDKARWLVDNWVPQRLGTGPRRHVPRRQLSPDAWAPVCASQTPADSRRGRAECHRRGHGPRPPAPEAAPPGRDVRERPARRAGARRPETSRRARSCGSC